MRLIQACARIPHSLTAVFGILFLAAFLSGCGSQYAPSSPTSQNPLSITIDEPTTSVSGGQNLQFTATTSSPTSGSIVWSVTGGGTISATGLYSSPVSVTSNTTVTVTATLSGNPSINASKTITVIPPAAVGISLPQGALPAVSAGGTLQLTANIGGPGSTVVWSLTGPGTISQTGLYTAPDPSTITAPTTVVVTATLANNSSVSASESLTLNPAPSIAITAPATVNLGQSTQLNASVVGSTGVPVWSLVSGPGTISAAGVYTAPATMPANAAVKVAATLSNNANIVATQSFNVVDPAVLTILPQISTVNTNQPIQFTATIGQSTGTAVWSIVSGAGSINPTTGLYTAPQTLPANTNVTVTATMSNDSSIFASQTFSLVANPAIIINAPASTVVGVNGTLQLTATVEGIVDGVNWAITSPSSGGGTISNGAAAKSLPPGDYTAPSTVPSPATVTITANLLSNPSITNSITLTIAGAPVIVSTSPASLPTGQNNTVTLTGTGFAPGMQILFNNELVPATVLSSTQATVQLSADPSFITETAPAGAVQLVAENPGGSNGAAFNLPVVAASATQVTVGTTPFLNVPLGFLGVSQEIGAGEWIMGDNARGVNYAQRTLYSYLMDTPNSPFLIRSGAGNTDNNPYDETPMSVEEYNELHAVMPGVKVSMGLILDSNSNTPGNSQSVPTYAADNAANYMVNLDPGVLDSFEIGNEPDAYGYTTYLFDHYIGNVNTWIGAIYDTIAPATPQFTGPSTSNLRTLTNNNYWSDFVAVNPSYFQVYAQDFKNYNKTLSHHFYSNNGSTAWPTGTTFTAKYLLGYPLPLSSGTQLPTALQWQNPGQTPYYWTPNVLGWGASVAHQYGMNFRVNEMNTIYGGGVAGASDAFAASLWFVDTLFEFMSNGVDGVNIHSETGGVRMVTVQTGCSTPPCTQASYYSPWTFNVNSLTHPFTYTLESVNPSFYGMYFFHKAIPDGSKLLPVTVQAPAYLKVWATQGPDGTIRVVLVNKDLTFSGTVPVNVPGHGTAQTLVMQSANAYNVGIQYANNTTQVGTTGITIGGQTWDGSSDGTIQGTQTLGSIAPSNGVYNVTVAPTSAVMLIIN